MRYSHERPNFKKISISQKTTPNFFSFFLSLFGAISIVQGENLSFLPFCVIICAACVTSSLSYDEMAKWDYTVLCMPITRRQVVKSKYLLLLIFTAFGVGFGLIVGGCSILLHSAPDFQALLLLLLHKRRHRALLWGFYASSSLPLWTGKKAESSPCCLLWLLHYVSALPQIFLISEHGAIFRPAICPSPIWRRLPRFFSWGFLI